MRATQGLEVAADSVASALAAQVGGAIRVELCGGLDGGGLTPSFGTVALAREQLRIPLYVLIRPRTGDFVYDAVEVETMYRDIELCVRLGCDGVVLGALDAAGQVDMPVMRMLIEAAGTLGVTFHRAFDVSADPMRALEQVIALGCERLLTSGACGRAEDGMSLISALISQARGRLSVMPGAGVSVVNLPLLQATGAYEFHASARIAVSARVSSVQPLVHGLDGNFLRTDVETVRQMVALLQA